MERKELINTLRALHFIVGLLENQQHDPRCGVCKSRAKIVEKVKEKLATFEEEHKGATLPEPFPILLTRTQGLLGNLKVPQNPIPQRKEGRCFFADQQCLVKVCFKVYEDLLKED